MTYQVKLEIFEGPLDLLLTLIERQELDITVVSLAKVTGQYLDYLQRLEQVRPDLLADFLVVAAKLIYIKSKALLPQPDEPEEEEDEEDVGRDLVRRLEEYRRFKVIAQTLAGREEAGLHAYVRIAPPPEIEPTQFHLEGVSLSDLLEAARQALEAAPPAPPASEMVSAYVVTVDQQIDLIRSHLEAEGRVGFHHLLQSPRNRTEIIVTLMAVLEMARRFQIVLRQDKAFGEIWIEEYPTPQAADAA